MGAGASVPSDVAACELELTIVAGKDLIAKDGGMFSKATSDPFVKATIGHMVLGQTPHVENSLNPEWNADLCTDTDVSAAAMQGGGAILLEIFEMMMQPQPSQQQVQQAAPVRVQARVVQP